MRGVGFIGAPALEVSIGHVLDFSRVTNAAASACSATLVDNGRRWRRPSFSAVMPAIMSRFASIVPTPTVGALQLAFLPIQTRGEL
jgi:hypothetical protein